MSHPFSRPLSRRTFAGGVAGLAVAMAGVRIADAQATPVASPEVGVWPRTVQAVNGPVEIAARPVRVLALTDWYEVDLLLTLGVKPVLFGALHRYGETATPWLIEAGVEELESYDISEAPDLELMVAARPDLIIADAYMSEQILDQLTAIAPVVVIPTPYTGSSDWREALILVGQSVGEEAAASVAIAETEATIEAGRVQMEPFAGREVTIAYATPYNGGSFFFSQPGSQESVIVEQLGLTYLGLGESNDPQSFELITQLEPADILIGYDVIGSPELLEANGLFQQLPAVVEGRYELVSEATALALFSPTVLSVRYAVAGFVEALTAAAEGNGRVLPVS